MTDRIDVGADTDVTVAPAWRGPQGLRALRHRDYSLFWSGQVISITGTWMQGLAQQWLVFKLTDSPIYLGYVGAAATVPILLFTLPAGVIADRLDKRKIIIVTQTMAMIQALALAALDFSGLVRAWHVIALASFLGMVNAFDAPPRQSMVVELVGKPDLLNAVALNSLAFNGGRIVGPAIGGVILAAYGTGVCFLINGLSFVAVIVALIIMRSHRLKASSRTVPMLKQIRQGLGYVRTNPLMRDLLIMTAVVSVFGSQYSTLMPVFAEKVYDVGPRGQGILVAGAGLGALSAALTIAWIGHRARPGRIVAAGSILAPLGLVAFAGSASYYLAVACLVVVGFGMMMFLAVSNSIMQMDSPDEMRGRVLSVRMLVFMGIGPPLGSMQVAVTAAWLGAREAVLISGLLCLTAAAYFAIGTRAVRRAA